MMFNGTRVLLWTCLTLSWHCGKKNGSIKTQGFASKVNKEAVASTTAAMSTLAPSEPDIPLGTNTLALPATATQEDTLLEELYGNAPASNISILQAALACQAQGDSYQYDPINGCVPKPSSFARLKEAQECPTGSWSDLLGCITAGTQERACLAAKLYWVNGICQHASTLSEQECSPATNTNTLELAENFASLQWYQGYCFDNPQQIACLQAGNYWFSNGKSNGGTCNTLSDFSANSTICLYAQQYYDVSWKNNACAANSKTNTLILASASPATSPVVPAINLGTLPAAQPGPTNAATICLPDEIYYPDANHPNDSSLYGGTPGCYSRTNAPSPDRLIYFTPTSFSSYRSDPNQAYLDYYFGYEGLGYIAHTEAQNSCLSRNKNLNFKDKELKCEYEINGFPDKPPSEWTLCQQPYARTFDLSATYGSAEWQSKYPEMLNFTLTCQDNVPTKIGPIPSFEYTNDIYGYTKNKKSITTSTTTFTATGQAFINYYWYATFNAKASPGFTSIYYSSYKNTTESLPSSIYTFWTDIYPLAGPSVKTHENLIIALQGSYQSQFVYDIWQCPAKFPFFAGAKSTYDRRIMLCANHDSPPQIKPDAYTTLPPCKNLSTVARDTSNNCVYNNQLESIYRANQQAPSTPEVAGVSSSSATTQSLCPSGRITSFAVTTRDSIATSITTASCGTQAIPVDALTCKTGSFSNITVYSNENQIVGYQLGCPNNETPVYIGRTPDSSPLPLTSTTLTCPTNPPPISPAPLYQSSSMLPVGIQTKKTGTAITQLGLLCGAWVIF